MFGLWQVSYNVRPLASKILFGSLPIKQCLVLLKEAIVFGPWKKSYSIWLLVNKLQCLAPGKQVTASGPWLYKLECLAPEY